MDLRGADTGIALIGWATAPNEVRLPGGRKMALWPMYVSAGYFQTVGVRPVRGTGFEGQTEAAVVLGYRFWHNNLSSDAEIIGKTIQLDNVPYVVAASRPLVMGMIVFDVVKLTTPGIGVGLLLAAAFLRPNSENMGISLSSVETFAYVPGAAIAMLVAVLAGLAPARRAAPVLPMVAIRSE